VASQGFIAPDLDPEVEALLLSLVDARSQVPRAQRQYYVSRPLGASGFAHIHCGPGGGRVEAAPQDLTALRKADLIEGVGPVNMRSGSYSFAITRRGHVVAEAIKQRGQPLERIEEAVVRYIEGSGFEKRYPGPARKWRQAVRFLGEDPLEHRTRIGRDCREALAASRLI
jgi:hypothetical protein